MKLVAKQKDYYDYLARNPDTSDQLHVWRRSPKIEAVRFTLPNTVYMSNTRYLPGNFKSPCSGMEALGFLVFFCGRVIPMAKIVETKQGATTPSKAR